MGYVATKGGEKAILNAEKLLDFFRTSFSERSINVNDIKNQLRLGCDKVISEASLYSPEIAALAIKQSEGDLIEASILLRAFRSTLPRIFYSESCNTEDMFVIRRISSAFKDIPGGQILGPTRDYIKRLINFDLLEEKEFVFKKQKIKKYKNIKKYPKVIDDLRKENLIDKPEKKQEEPYDITRQPIVFPMKRSGILQALTRGEEGAVMAIAYSSMRGYGDTHPTLAELRVGYIKVKIFHPLIKKEVVIGEILVTETEMISGKPVKGKDGLPKFNLGYGLVFGHNERKAICMALLDMTLSIKDKKYVSEDQEFVISHIDSIESSGFTTHWKLPHYVTFQSDLDRLRKMIEESKKNEKL